MTYRPNNAKLKISQFHIFFGSCQNSNVPLEIHYKEQKPLGYEQGHNANHK